MYHSRYTVNICYTSSFQFKNLLLDPCTSSLNLPLIKHFKMLKQQHQSICSFCELNLNRTDGIQALHFTDTGSPPCSARVEPVNNPVL